MRTLPYLFLILVLLSSATSVVHAASLQFESFVEEMRVGERIPLTLMLQTEGETLNAVEGSVRASSGLKIVSIREDDSVVSLWVERPNVESGTFSGLMPGGFSGVVGPFWEGNRAGKLYTLVVEGVLPGEHTLWFESAQAYRNDGSGTAVETTAYTRVITVVPETTPLPVQSGETALAQDTTPPEPFEPFIGESPDLFNGDAFIAFSATDAESGVARYEIAESWNADPARARFVPAESPYALKDPGRHFYVHVRAIDRAGNIRTETIPPTHPIPWLIVISLGILGIIAAVGFHFYRRTYAT